MEQMLDDVRIDAMGKIRYLREEEKKLLSDAAILAMEFWLNFYGDNSGLICISRVEEEVNEKVEDELFKWIVLKSIYGGNDEDFYAEMITSEYWIKNPQGVKAMVFCIYIYGIFYALTFKTFEEGESRMFFLLPKDCHPIFEKQMEKIRRQWGELQGKKRIRRIEDLDDEDKESVENLFRFHPVIKNAELREKLHVLEEVIRNLTDSSIVEVINHMGNEEYDCFYAFSNETRKKIIYDALRAKEDCSISFSCLRHVAKQEEREEEELLGAVLYMLGKIKRLRKLGKIKVMKNEPNFI